MKLMWNGTEVTWMWVQSDANHSFPVSIKQADLWKQMIYSDDQRRRAPVGCDPHSEIVFSSKEIWKTTDEHLHYTGYKQIYDPFSYSYFKKKKRHYNYVLHS